ncbi:MAG: hypothetical protein QM572_01175 [Nocardioides sp.]|uniref:hypothetical protein n=1 Tax=Nocardioides sp. TaxID=35761 RepID=UPI0039E51258
MPDRKDRELVVRAVHRDEPDLRRLAEAMIRLALEDSGRTRVELRAATPPQTFQPTRAAS